MTMKRLIYTLVIMITAISCGKFDEYNTNPDSTTEASAALLATGVELGTFEHSGDAVAYISNNALPKYVAYLNESGTATQYNEIGRCSFGSYIWWPTLEQMVKYASGTIYEPSYRGLAGFIKAWNAWYLTMQTGDIPYSEAGQGASGNVTPKYDTQEQVFVQILADLAEAERQFAAGETFTGDIIYNGDVTKWRKATNAFRLKVIMSLGEKASQAQKEEFAGIVSAGNLMEDNADNLQLVYTSTEGTWHPLYNQTLFNPYTVLSETVAESLKELQDRRLFYFAEPAEEQLAAGLEESDYEAYTGADTSEDFEKLTTALSTSGSFSVINDRYIEVQGGDPFIHLSYAEQELILAEAAELGWITGSAEGYYMSGTEAALRMVAAFDKDNAYCHGMPIDESYISGYFNGEAAFASTQQERLEQIWMQKYLLKFLQDGYDAYFDFRRTGFPDLPNNPDTSMNIDDKTAFPARWQYPASETETNYGNLTEALTRQFTNGYDGINEKPWILK